MLSRIAWGLRSSLWIASASVGLAVALGIVIGICGAYFGGKTDLFVQFITDVLMAFPTLVLGVIVIMAVGRGQPQLILAITLAILPRLIRLTRAQVIPLRTRPFVEAAQGLGATHLRIIAKHIIPNSITEIVVMAILWFATAVVLEAGLSFLGLGLNPPAPSLGGIIRQGMQDIFTAPWITVLPITILVVLSVALNLLGDFFQSWIEAR
jgi:peptide/nickel transport system permease protein